MPKDSRSMRVANSVSATEDNNMPLPQVRSSRQRRDVRTLNIPNDHGNPATSEQTMTSTTCVPSADYIAQAILVQINQDPSGQYSSLRSALNISPSMSVAQNNDTHNNAIPLQNSVAATCTLYFNSNSDNKSDYIEFHWLQCFKQHRWRYMQYSGSYNSLPLAYHITDMSRNSIFSEIYVDFAAFFPNCHKSEKAYNIGQGINLTTTGSTIIRSLTSIMQWCNAFDTFMSIYISKYPNLALDLIKYGNNIRKFRLIMVSGL